MRIVLPALVSMASLTRARDRTGVLQERQRPIARPIARLVARLISISGLRRHALMVDAKFAAALNEAREHDCLATVNVTPIGNIGWADGSPSLGRRAATAGDGNAKAGGNVSATSTCLRVEASGERLSKHHGLR